MPRFAILLAWVASAAHGIDYWECSFHRLDSGYQPAGQAELGPSEIPVHWSTILPENRGKGPRMADPGLKGLEPWLVLEMRRKAEDGYVLGSVRRQGENFLMQFYRDPNLIAEYQRPKEPDYVERQRRLLGSKWSGKVEPVAALRETNDPPAMPQGMALTSKSLGTLPDGVYSFVQLQGENFLRIVPEGQAQHVKAGGMEKAISAGEIQIHREDGKLTVAMSLASGTYKPGMQTFRPALESLWRQGIFPPDLFLHLPAPAPREGLLGRRPILNLSVAALP